MITDSNLSVGSQFASAESMSPYGTPFPMDEILSPSIPKRIIFCESYPSVQAAVNACAALGGGTVIVDSGIHETGPIHLKSHICLHLKEGAVLRFSDRPSDYLPVVFTRWEGTECYNYSPLIYAIDCTDIAITGTGTLDGNGNAWWPWKKLQQPGADRLYNAGASGIPVEERIFGTEADALRPSFLQFVRCSRILLSDFTITDGPQWTIHPVYCSEVTVRSVNVSTHGPNTDGLNPDSCRRVLIENCRFETGDDCIAINSGINEDGWRVGIPCEDIVIRNCRMTGGHGGLVIGSAESGNVRHIYACDCEIDGPAQGIRLKSMRGRGGVVEDVLFERIQIDNTPLEAILINMFYDASTVVPKTLTPPVFRRIMIRNVSGSGCGTAILLKGLPEQKLEDVILEDISIQAEQSFVSSDISGLTLNHVMI